MGEKRPSWFEVLYVFKGVVHKYRPDFIIRLKSGNFLVLEVKGQETQQDQTKREFLDEWVKAVNEHGGFGKWDWAASRVPGDVSEILQSRRQAFNSRALSQKIGGILRNRESFLKASTSK